MPVGVASDLEKWNERYRQSKSEPVPCRVLLENQHLLPVRGKSLDVACGLGGNALLLAERGLESVAWDLSPVAIDRLRQWADERGLPVRAGVHDLTNGPLPESGFDVIVVSRFLERALLPMLIEALTPGGLLFYQTFTRVHVGDKGPSDPAWRLAENELLALFRGLHILVYREEGRVGDLGRGFRDEALLVGRKGGYS